ncbi:Mur ligase [Macrolepiota fuliginosa MF-IS2]|uniref:Mur ligase n=1 Tax=Macrolepiota fuliginosa MF-IS2 TaxID=1400762 RepID=A0A9P6C1A2_9AGAR|nr:Mur ligase [Macrolepiota fuliginosa MF-IS2]
MSIDLSLDRLQLAVQYLPTYTRPTYHIAGTNGKGSVTAIISSILRVTSPPLNVGRYNSPHLIAINDCIVINDNPVDTELLNSVRAEVERVDAEQGTKLSNFELLTLTALQIFERVGVDIAVVEVGMGGRLDATNIIPNEAILVSALTSVDLDHQAFLGNTISAIATEKAGIARSGTPFVLGPQKYPEVAVAVKVVLREKGTELAPLLAVHQISNATPLDFSLRPLSFHPPPKCQVSCSLSPFLEGITANFPLYGEHQLENLATALSVISATLTIKTPTLDRISCLLTPLAITRGIDQVQWRGRLSFHTTPSPKTVPVLVDGAHNPASATALANYINRILSLSTDAIIDLTYILALSNSPPKTPLQTLSPLLLTHLSNELRRRVRVHVALLSFSSPAGMPWVKATPPSDLVTVVRALIPDADTWVAGEDVELGVLLPSAVDWAADRTEDAGLIVVAGSLYLVSDYYRIYGEARSSDTNSSPGPVAHQPNSNPSPHNNPPVRRVNRYEV